MKHLAKKAWSLLLAVGLAVATLGIIPATAYADYGEYDPADVAWVNSFIDANDGFWEKWDNPLNPTPPATWDANFKWDDSTPKRLERIIVGGAFITVLPVLPSALRYLDCNDCSLTEIPGPLPSGLVSLLCWSNQLTSLPSLPSSLESLDCSFNPIAVLPVLPNGLLALSCRGTLLTTLPELPPSLEYLRCYDSKLTALPTLPAGLGYLNCIGNQITSIDTSSCYWNLTTLRIQDNPLTKISLDGINTIELVATGNGKIEIVDYYLVADGDRYITVKAIPDTGATLVKWSYSDLGDYISIDSDTCKYSIPSSESELNMVITASFTQTGGGTPTNPPETINPPGTTNPPKTPNTGDSTGVAMFMVMLLSLAGAIVSISRQKRKTGIN